MKAITEEQISLIRQINKLAKEKLDIEKQDQTRRSFHSQQVHKSLQKMEEDAIQTQVARILNGTPLTKAFKEQKARYRKGRIILQHQGDVMPYE